MALVSAVGIVSCSAAKPLSTLSLMGPITGPKTVFVRAVYRGQVSGGPCPPDALCQPCLPVVLIAESAEAKPEEIVWVFSTFDTPQNLVEGRTYVFELSLRPDYERQLTSHDNNPVYFDGPPPLELLEVHED